MKECLQSFDIVLMSKASKIDLKNVETWIDHNFIKVKSTFNDQFEILESEVKENLKFVKDMIDEYENRFEEKTCKIVDSEIARKMVKYDAVTK